MALAAHPGVRRGGRPADRSGRRRPSWSPAGTGARPRSTPAMVDGGRAARLGPASAGIAEEAARGRLARSPSRRRRPSRPCAAVLEHAVGRRARRATSRSSPATSSPRKKPAPDIYQLAVSQLRRRPGRRRRGRGQPQRAARRARRRPRLRRHDEQLHPRRGLHRRRARGVDASATRRRAGRGAGRPARRCDPDPSSTCRTCRSWRRHDPTDQQGDHVDEHQIAQLEFVVRTIAQTAVDNEKEFGDLDAVVGDGDFGYSLARGFEIVRRRLGHLRPRRLRRRS